jgi:cytidylate kinase
MTFSKDPSFAGYSPTTIVITSASGVGGSSTVRELKELLPSYEFVSASVLMGQLAKQLRMSKRELARFNRDHPELGYDLWCVSEVEAKAKGGMKLVETRLPHTVQHGFHVLLNCPVPKRAERRQKDPDFQSKTVVEIAIEIAQRDEDDATRLEQIYPGSAWGEEDFDCVASTEFDRPPYIARKITRLHREWVSSMTAAGKILK